MEPERFSFGLRQLSPSSLPGKASCASSALNGFHVCQVPCLPGSWLPSHRCSQARNSISSLVAPPPPGSRWIGIGIATFEACSGLTHVTAQLGSASADRPICRRTEPSRKARGNKHESEAGHSLSATMQGWHVWNPELEAECRAGNFRVGGASITQVSMLLL